MRSPVYNSFFHPPVPLGAHLVSDRLLYSHHGIYIGDSKVIHYSGLADGMESGPVEEISIVHFGGRDGFQIQEHEDPKYSPEQVVERAKSRLGEDEYCAQTNNCEHFCMWAITGVSTSAQSKRVVKATKVLASLIGGPGAAIVGGTLAIRELNGKVRNSQLDLDRKPGGWPFPTKSRP